MTNSMYGLVYREKAAKPASERGIVGGAKVSLYGKIGETVIVFLTTVQAKSVLKDSTASCIVRVHIWKCDYWQYIDSKQRKRDMRRGCELPGRFPFGYETKSKLFVWGRSEMKSKRCLGNIKRGREIIKTNPAKPGSGNSSNTRVNGGKQGTNSGQRPSNGTDQQSLSNTVTRCGIPWNTSLVPLAEISALTLRQGGHGGIRPSPTARCSMTTTDKPWF